MVCAQPCALLSWSLGLELTNQQSVRGPVWAPQGDVKLYSHSECRAMPPKRRCPQLIMLCYSWVPVLTCNEPKLTWVITCAHRQLCSSIRQLSAMPTCMPWAWGPAPSCCACSPQSASADTCRAPSLRSCSAQAPTFSSAWVRSYLSCRAARLLHLRVRDQVPLPSDPHAHQQAVGGLADAG